MAGSTNLRASASDGWTVGWMDGVDLIICVAIWMLYRRRLPLVSDDFLASSIASRNRLRSASLFVRISEDFGGQHGGQNSIFEHFLSMLFSMSFSHRFLVDFCRLQTRKIAIFLRKSSDFCKIGSFNKDAKNVEFWLRFR